MKDTEINWFKLDDFKSIWTKEIQKKLPTDCNFSEDDIHSELDDCLIYRVKHYKPMTKGSSMETYIYSCKDYIIKTAYGKLIKEYKRIKNELTLDDIKDDDDEYVERHKVSPSCHIDRNQDTHKSVEDRLDNNMNVQLMTKLYEVAIKMDKETEMTYDYAYIIDLAKQGISQQDIADELGTNKMEISRRLKRISERARKERI